MDAICNNGKCLAERLEWAAGICQGNAREASMNLGDNGQSDAQQHKLREAVKKDQEQATMFTAGAKDLRSRHPSVCTGKGRCWATVYMSR